MEVIQIEPMGGDLQIMLKEVRCSKKKINDHQINITASEKLFSLSQGTILLEGFSKKSPEGVITQSCYKILRVKSKRKGAIRGHNYYECIVKWRNKPSEL